MLWKTRFLLVAAGVAMLLATPALARQPTGKRQTPLNPAATGRSSAKVATQPPKSLPRLAPNRQADSVPRDICGIQTPPKRYANAPLPHLTNSTTPIAVDGPHYTTPAAVASLCNDSGYRDAVGCTQSILLGRTIIAFKVLIASNPVPGTDKRCTRDKWRASIWRHERAHMAGWPPNHPR